jgi:hypothetical protein
VSDRETRTVLESIAGGPELIAWFGKGVGFHDAEIGCLVLDREGGSRLDVLVVRDSPHTTIRFHLRDWIDTDIRGFSHQNVVGEIFFRRAGDRQVDQWELGVGLAPGEHEIELEPIFGAFGKLRCTIARIEILPPTPAK